MQYELYTHSEALTARRYSEPFFVKALDDSIELVTPEADFKSRANTKQINENMDLDTGYKRANTSKQQTKKEREVVITC